MKINLDKIKDARYVFRDTLEYAKFGFYNYERGSRKYLSKDILYYALTSIAYSRMYALIMQSPVEALSHENFYQEI